MALIFLNSDVAIFRQMNRKEKVVLGIHNSRASLNALVVQQVLLLSTCISVYVCPRLFLFGILIERDISCTNAKLPCEDGANE